MGNLKAQGFRLMVRKAGNYAAWIHPAEAKTMVGYTDCTDMDDAEFMEFIAAPAV